MAKKPPPVNFMKIYKKNFQTFEECLRNGCLYGVGITPKGNIALELNIKSGNMRLAVVYQRDRDTIVHACPAMKAQKPCWHLAAAADVYAMAFNRPLPQTDIPVNVKNFHITSGYVGVDITPEYLEYKGLPPQDGDFAIFNYQPVQMEQPQPSFDYTSLRVIEEPKPINCWKQVLKSAALAMQTTIASIFD